MDRGLVEEDADSLTQVRNSIMFGDQLVSGLWNLNFEGLKVQVFGSWECLLVEEGELDFALRVREHIVWTLVVEDRRSN
jgi:hypothetical protein